MSNDSSKEIREGKEHLGGMKPRPERQRPDGSPGAEPRSLSESEEAQLLSAGIDIVEVRHDHETDTDEVLGIKRATGQTTIYRDVHPANLQLIRERAQYIAATSDESYSVNLACIIEQLVDAIQGDEDAVAALRFLGVEWRD